MIYLGADHAGFDLKNAIAEYLVKLNIKFVDLGNVKFDKNDDYPDYIFPVAKKVSEDPENNRGIIIGGSGEGEAITANRIKGVRAALFYGPVTAKQGVDAVGRISDDPFEIVKLSRLHNNTNIISIGARFLTVDEALQAVKIWLSTEFSHESRHIKRIKKIDNNN